MTCRLLTWVLAFLLLGMQQQVQLHALTHFADWLQTSQDQGVSADDAEPVCLECLLLAAAANAAAVDSRSLQDASAGFTVQRSTACRR